MRHLTDWTTRALFVVAFALAGLAVFERLANLFGYTVLRAAYAPSRLLELAAIALLFVFALLLRDIRHALVPGEWP